VFSRVQAATGGLDLWWVLEQRVAKESLIDRSHGGLAHGRVVRRTVDRGGARRKPVTENAGVQPSASSARSVERSEVKDVGGNVCEVGNPGGVRASRGIRVFSQ
jgi:hypothetical protein